MKISQIFFVWALILLVQSLIMKAHAQDFTTQYIPFRDYRADSESIEEIAKSFLHSDFSHDNKKIRKAVLEMFNDHSERFISLDEASRIMYKDDITNYLTQLTQKIVAKNPELKNKDYKVFTYRTGVPNASSYGEGVIMVHLGLLYKLSSEAELAFVLCHELSHDLQNHVYDGVVGKAEFIESAEFQAEIKKIKKLDYNQKEEYEKLVKRYLHRFSEHGQDHELESDAMGLTFFYNAGYSPSDAIKVIQKLDSIDLPLYKNVPNLKNHFDFPEYPFKDGWLKNENRVGLLGGNLHTFILPDSLKTHPNCIVRVEALEKIIKTKNMKMQEPATVAEDFSVYSNMARFEIIEYSMEINRYGFALFYALNLLEEYPENLYLKCAVTNCLYEIYSAQMKHRFSYVVDYQDQFYSPQYNEFLAFLHNLRAKEIKNLMDAYYKTHLNDKNGDPYTGYVKALLKSIESPAEDKTALVEEFKKKYNHPYYSKILNEKFTATSN